MNRTRFLGILFSLGFAARLLADAAPAPLAMEHVIDLNAFNGKTFLQAMTAKGGIKEALDDDFQKEYRIAKWPVVKAALNNFDTKVVGKVLRSFRDGETGLKALTESLAGKKFQPAGMVGVVRPALGGGDVFAVAQLLAMASGAGTLVTLDDESYYYNYGYKSGAEADDVKSGRSFGASPGHRANDASDLFYLAELKDLLADKKAHKEFYETILELLTKCEAAGFKGEMTQAAETVATDFIAIYTAELDRHLMVGLNPARHPWENDLAEVTFVSAYGVEAGKVMLIEEEGGEGKLVDGEPKQYWEKSKISNRSGIGQTRQPRRKLQKLISAFERENNPELVKAIEQVTGERRDGDVYRGMMEYLNSARYLKSPRAQDEVTKNAGALTEAFVKFLAQTRKDANQITKYVLANE
jgi:hypothetical protein